MKYYHQELDKYVDTASGGRVLDAGCGEGRLLERFKRKGFFVVGIEKNSAISFLPSIEDKVVIADMHDWFKKNKGRETFDVIIFSFSLMFIPKSKRDVIVQLAKSSLRENGLLYIGVFNEDEDSKWSISEHEYLGWASGMQIAHIERETIHDAPHRGRWEPHRHYVTHILLTSSPS